MSFVKQAVLLLVIAAAGTGAWLGGLLPSAGPVAGSEQAARARSAASRPPAPVIVRPVRLVSSASVIEAVGTGVALRAVMLHPLASGRVEAVHFGAGQQVSSGTSLLELDAEQERLAVRLARVRVDEARQQWRRYDSAAPSGAVPDGDVQDALTRLEAARIQLQQARLALERRVLRAPFDGVIGMAHVQAGDRVDEQTAVASLDDRSALLVDFDVPELFAASIRTGQPVDTTTWALPGQHHAGTVQALGSRVDAQTRTLRVRARIPNGDDRLRPGMSFVIRVQLSGERFPSVPSIAVLWDRGGAYVWRLTGSAPAERAERVTVEVLKREDDWVLVDAPLRAGDRVVVEGVQRLRAGRAVRIVEQQEARNADA